MNSEKHTKMLFYQPPRKLIEQIQLKSRQLLEAPTIMKRQIGIILAVILLASFVTAQADVTLAPKVPAAPEKVVIVMFDDGWLSQYTTALPILQKPWH